MQSFAFQKLCGCSLQEKPQTSNRAKSALPSLHSVENHPGAVIPAKAGIQAVRRLTWTPRLRGDNNYGDLHALGWVKASVAQRGGAATKANWVACATRRHIGTQYVEAL